MNEKDWESMARLDEAVERLANGCYTIPVDPSAPNYNIRAIAREAERLSRPLTYEEAEKFRLPE